MLGTGLELVNVTSPELACVQTHTENKGEKMKTKGRRLSRGINIVPLSFECTVSVCVCTANLVRVHTIPLTHMASNSHSVNVHVVFNVCRRETDISSIKFSNEYIS